MRAILFFFGLFLCFNSIAQNDMSSDHPANQLWEFDGNKDAAAPIIDDMAQKFFFLLPNGSEKSMMAPFDIGGSFACPTYFKLTLDDDYLYLNIGKSCVEDLTKEEKLVKLKYKFDGPGLVLLIDGIEYRYKIWKSESNIAPKDAPKKMTIDYVKATELLKKGGWHPASRNSLLFKGIHTIKITGKDENGYELLTIKGVNEQKESFEFKVRIEDIESSNDYALISINEDDASKLCSHIYCYFEDSNNAKFFFSNSWFDLTDSELKDQNWMPSRR